MKKPAKTSSEIINNEKGIVLVIALIMLCMMTIIGTAVSNTSSVETMISGVEKDQREAFYVAEAGVDHAKGLLKSYYVQKNALKIAAGVDPDWDFALDGSLPGMSVASDTDISGGVQLITNGTMGGKYTYNVFIWDNEDVGNNIPFDATEYATDDGDGIIYVRSTAVGPFGESSIEISIQGSVSGVTSITGYAAQAGAGSGKNYSAEDADAISNFTEQL